MSFKQEAGVLKSCVIITNVYIYYNIISASPLCSIQINSQYENVYIWNNTIYNSASVDVYFNDDAGVAEVKNNIGYSSLAINHHVRLMADAPSNKTFDTNLWYGGAYIAQVDSAFDDILRAEWNLYPVGAYAGITVGADLDSDPLFNNPGTYFLPKYSSPAIDAGTDVSLTIVYTGGKVPRGAAVDIGAYEYAPNAIKDTLKAILIGIGISL